MAERIPFYGSRLPADVKLLLKAFGKEMDKKLFRQIMQLAVETIEGVDIPDERIAELQTNTMDQESLGVCITGMTHLLRAALRLPLTSLKPEHFKADLVELKVPEDFINDLSKVVFGPRRETIEQAYSENRSRLPTVEDLRWRVDVGISTSALSRTLKPSVLMQVTLSDGKVHVVEFATEKFHELRYNVAYVLKEMEDLEKKSILKIQD